MLYKKIIDDDNIIFFTQDSEIFITDENNADILGMKLKGETSKRLRVEQELVKKMKLKKLIILLTSACNLRCRYCYLNYGDYTNEKHFKNIDVDIAKKAIDQILKDFPEGIGFIQFFGGEPLIAFQELKEIVDYIEKTFGEHKITIPRFGLVTNGLLLNPDIIEYMNQKRISFSVSIDGDKDIHNNVRVGLGELDSYDRIRSNIEEYKKLVNSPMFFEMTFNHEHVMEYEEGKMEYWLESIRSIGFTSGIMGIVEFARDKTLDIQKDDIPIMKSMYKELTDYFFSILKLNKPDFYNLDICKITLLILKKDLEPYCCGAGVNQLTLSTDGTYYPCPKFADCNKKIGNASSELIDYNSMKELIVSDNRELCQGCWMKGICKSYCYALKYRNKDNRNVIASRCVHLSLLTENVIKNIVIAKKEGELSKVISNIQNYLKQLT